MFEVVAGFFRDHAYTSPAMKLVAVYYTLAVARSMRDSSRRLAVAELMLHVVLAVEATFDCNRLGALLLGNDHHGLHENCLKRKTLNVRRDAKEHDHRDGRNTRDSTSIMEPI